MESAASSSTTRSQAPSDLILIYASKGDRARATKVCENYLSALEKNRPSAPPWSSTRVRLIRAQWSLDAKKAEEAKAELAKIDTDASMEPWEAWQGGVLFEQLEDRDRAVRLHQRLADEGYRPFLRLARLYLTQENWVEVMRNLNRARLYGSDAEIAPPHVLFDASFATPSDPFKREETPCAGTAVSGASGRS